MNHTFTKRNHYNPCFWIALWSESYLKQLENGSNDALIPRDQKIYSLNFRSDKIMNTIVNNVHYDKNLGVAPITPESARCFCKKYYPDRYQEVDCYLQKDSETVYLDFEEILTELENTGTYSSILDLVKNKKIKSMEQKGFISCAIALQAMRSHEFMEAMINNFGPFSIPKFEYFWMLKNAWGNPLVLGRAATAIALGHWTIYRTRKYMFPFPDSPVLIKNNSIMLIISPNILLEINVSKKANKDICKYNSRISFFKYREFRKRTIKNTFKDLVFIEKNILYKWKITKEYQSQISILKIKEQREKMIKEAALRIIWAINGFGIIPNDYESKMQKIFFA